MSHGPQNAGYLVQFFSVETTAKLVASLSWWNIQSLGKRSFQFCVEPQAQGKGTLLEIIRLGGKTLWPVGFLLDVATNTFSPTAAFPCYALFLELIPSNQENVSPQAHIHLTITTMRLVGSGMMLSLPFLASRSTDCPHYREINSKRNGLPSALDLIMGFAIVSFSSLLQLPLRKVSYFFSQLVLKLAEIPPRCDSYVVGTISWFPAGDCLPALDPSLFSLVISVIFLEENEACVYVVILPVSLLFIFSSIFF